MMSNLDLDGSSCVAVLSSASSVVKSEINSSGVVLGIKLHDEGCQTGEGLSSLDDENNGSHNRSEAEWDVNIQSNEDPTKSEEEEEVDSQTNERSNDASPDPPQRGRNTFLLDYSMTSVQFPLRQNACSGPTFEADYSIHLRPVMSQPEFDHVFQQINQQWKRVSPSLWWIWGSIIATFVGLGVYFFFLFALGWIFIGLYVYIPFCFAPVVGTVVFVVKRRKSFTSLAPLIVQLNAQYNARGINFRLHHGTSGGQYGNTGASIEIEIAHHQGGAPAIAVPMYGPPGYQQPVFVATQYQPTPNVGYPSESANEPLLKK
eukprot:TRINITY_DN1695_c0_g1_i4.p1 TRINITY_DN1695_c0_g1~~TRINITY_DN1695_c0_g1_i4.p1  ORF type:complete len:317 (-),score=50.98 TRINITY_DN1695_c0_g1_i4:208-1158(-)